MHEYSAIQKIIRTAELAAAENGAVRVSEVHLVIGDQSGIMPDSCRTYFKIIGQGTACEGAELVIEMIESKLLCGRCGAHFKRRAFTFTCPECGGEGEPTEEGREFYIKEITAE